MISNHDGSTQDPIIKLLLDRTDFRKLLHEITLYLLNKSILIEKESVYQNLMKLYRTRNKIVHWGAPIDDDPTRLVTINSQEAYLAIEMAFEVFNWIGITRFNPLLNTSFTIIK